MTHRRRLAVAGLIVLSTAGLLFYRYSPYSPGFNPGPRPPESVFGKLRHVPRFDEHAELRVTQPGPLQGIRISGPQMQKLQERDYFNADKPDRIAEFGELAVQLPGNDRFLLFSNGKYLDAPYDIRFRGTGLYINGTLCDSVPWRPVSYDLPDAKIPAGVSSWSSFDRLQVGGQQRLWHQLRANWLDWHHAPDQAIVLFTQDLKSLPFVRSVEVTDVPPPSDRNDFAACAWAMSGTRIREIRVRGFRPANDRRFRWPVDDNSRQARGQVLTRELLDKHRKRWLNELAYFSKIGGVDFLGVGWLGGTAETLRRRYYYFPEVFEILQSSDDENRKLDRLASLDRERSLDWSDLRLRDRCQLMIRTFQSSPQLEERLKVFKSRRMEEAVRQPVQ